ncbi:TetR/AcrR family transcriptional regulator [Pseudonocardia sp. ICBG1142]|uniref:TetR/AcrR family transcriptional regulator n=1 Tax=Pseudonocardia sp. ICBG1142 TaxID=2846760 RepID=UPI001CF6D130|nr:TetR/AcrR family transcriptional regulator [Pseudonocardia sp. ICBG1142]
MAAGDDRPGEAHPQDVQGFRHGRVPRAVRAQQLLDCAEALFVEHGLDGVSVEDICRAAEVSRPVFYDHFGSRTGAYIACVRRIRQEFQEGLLGLMRVAESADLATVFRVAGEAFFTLIEQAPHRWAMLYPAMGLSRESADQLESLREETVQTLVVLIRTRLPEFSTTDAMVAAQMISGGGEQLGRWWLRHRDEASRDEVIDAYQRYATAALLGM